MINKQLGVKLSALTLALILAGCGGGGSDGYYNNGGSSSGNTGGSGNGIETPAISKLNISNVEIIDPNNKTTTIVTSSGATAQLVVTDDNNLPLSGALVTFSGEGISFNTSNASILTDMNGVAAIAIKPVDDQITGAYKISAAVEVGENTAQSATTNFTIGQLQAKFDNVNLEQSTIDAGASVKLTARTLDKETGEPLNNVKVSFEAECGIFNTNETYSNQGVVETIYTAISSAGQLCTGSQQLKLSLNNGAVTATQNVKINEIKANSIVYTAGELKLGILSSGSSSSGKVEFTVYSNNVPARNQVVNVELVNAPDDFSFVYLNNKGTQPITSDDQGRVIVDVFPGSIPGPVEIKATLKDDVQVTALSKGVSVATGRVTQNGFSLSVSKNALQWNVDGDKATITARLRDRVGNKVPDGTVVSFNTEGGSITPNCSTVNGECSVELQTQDPRPADNRVTVLAYVEGDKTYIDKNSDNLYTVGIDELSSNTGDFFRDDNENNIFENALGEFLYKRELFGIQAVCAPSTISQPNIPFKLDTTGQPTSISTCNNELSTVIRKQLIFAFSNDTPTVYDAKITNRAAFSFSLFGNNARSVPMPTGTTVVVNVEDNTKDNELSCSAELWNGSATVPGVFNLLTPSTFMNSTQTYYSYRLKECDAGDSLILSVTAPNGQVRKREYILN